MFFVSFCFVIFNLSLHTNIFCTFKVSTILLPQRIHWYKFYLARFVMCPCVWFLVISPLPHIVQWYGFFPIILLLCIFEWFLNMNFLPHSAQGFRYSSAQLFSSLLHRAQWNINFPYYEFLRGNLCGLLCGVWLYIPHFIIMARNNATFQYVFYVPLPFTFFSLILVLQVFFYPDCNDLTAEINMVLS